MEKIKEDDVIRILKSIDNKNIKIMINGSFEQSFILKNIEINFLENNTKIQFKNKNYNFILNFSYIEEIYFKQKNKLKFLMENQLEILIIFL